MSLLNELEMKDSKNERKKAEKIKIDLENFSSIYCLFTTHLPSACRKNETLSLLPRLASEMLTAPGSDFFKIACSKPCGATSMVMALVGKCLDASSNKTELNKLFVW